ncbi:hypothetical protein BLNAU_9859 [Blattamonas nauphoetae]|uniref:Uncharacterized protein n=1 Tax=Blattamonas nauphoetae TaxID=2049346 RepID=A0ABQ9XUI6_9EUKA|nr:hypothetical protein BLNAU_9859 [Blattamonas nauphoetae]
MDWFVEAVIGAYTFRKQPISEPPLTLENIRIDASSTIFISPPSSPQQQSIAGSLCSDIATICQFFLHIHRTLEQQNRLTLPLDPEEEHIVFARIMVALVEHFVASGDLILPNPSPTYYSQFFETMYLQLKATAREPLNLFLLKNLAMSFKSLVRIPHLRHSFVPTDNSFLCRKKFQHSDQFLDVVKNIKETHSLEAVRNAHYDWKEWMTMMELVGQGVSDLSFLQSRSNQTSPQDVDLNEKFDESLFDETDDMKVATSLYRCLNVVGRTKSTECILNLHTFRTFLISGLHSSNVFIQVFCYLLFFDIGDLLPTVDDPREHRFDTIRMAFRDGTYWEKMGLLRLWVRWLDIKSDSGRGKVISEQAFDFDGFLSVEMENLSLFDMACSFVDRFLLNDFVSMSFRWKMNVLLQFEKRHRVLDRLTSDPSGFSKQKRSRHFLSPLAIILGSFLSLFNGIDFPSVLTELMTIDLDSSPLKCSRWINPAFFLTYTSIAPKHQPNFFPMDLMFERAFRDDPNDFLRLSPDPALCTSRKFLQAPVVGLHSLLLRYPKLNLNQQTLFKLMHMLFVEISGHDIKQVEVGNLFCYFPPPRFIDTLLSSPHHVRHDEQFWLYFLNVVCAFFAVTTPFGACSSLTTIFKMLHPFDSDTKEAELTLMRMAGDIIVSLHWLSIPAHFDSPLLCHLPSLAGAQRGILQTLSSHSGIPSLITPHNLQPNWNSIILPLLSKDHSVSDGISVQCLCVRYFTFSGLVSLLSFYCRIVLYSHWTVST